MAGDGEGRCDGHEHRVETNLAHLNGILSILGNTEFNDVISA